MLVTPSATAYIPAAPAKVRDLDREPLPIDRHSRDLHIVKLVLVASSPDDDLMRATSVDD